MSAVTTAICASSPVGCAVASGVGSAVSSVASGAFQQTASNIFSGWDDLIKQFLTSWVGSGFLVSLDNSATKWFQGSILSVNVLLLVVGLTIAGIRTMYAQRSQPFREALHSLARVVAVTTIGSAAIQVLVSGGDAYAQWILKESGTSASAGQLDANFATSSPGLALVFGLLGIIAVGIQWAIMYVRQAMLLLLNAFWPTTASYAMLRQGQQAFEKVTTWIFAFILYSPLAASIYAFAWKLKDGQDGAGGVIYGLMLICLAIMALPAMLRLIVPAASALGNASGGAMALGLGAAAVSAGVAVGAAVATGGGSAAAGAGAGKTAATTSGGNAAETAAGGQSPAGKTAPEDSGSAASLAGGGNGDQNAGSGNAQGSSTGGDSSSSGDGAGGQESGGAGSGGSGRTASGSDAASGQSAGSKGGWTAAQAAAEGMPKDGSTAEGMIGE